MEGWTGKELQEKETSPEAEGASQNHFTPLESVKERPVRSGLLLELSKAAPSAPCATACAAETGGLVTAMGNSSARYGGKHPCARDRGAAYQGLCHRCHCQTASPLTAHWLLPAASHWYQSGELEWVQRESQKWSESWSTSLCKQAERTGAAQPGEEKALGSRPHSSLPVTEGNLQESWRTREMPLKWE